MPEFSAQNVTCDGAHFTALSHHGVIEGSGSFKSKDGENIGIICGTVKTGPGELLNRSISIRVEGDSGICYIP